MKSIVGGVKCKLHRTPYGADAFAPTQGHPPAEPQLPSVPTGASVRCPQTSSSRNSPATQTGPNKEPSGGRKDDCLDPADSFRNRSEFLSDRSTLLVPLLGSLFNCRTGCCQGKSESIPCRMVPHSQVAPSREPRNRRRRCNSNRLPLRFFSFVISIAMEELPGAYDAMFMLLKLTRHQSWAASRPLARLILSDLFPA